MSPGTRHGKHLPKIFDDRVARERVRFWYWLIQSAHKAKGEKELTPRELENKFSLDGVLEVGDRGSRIWGKYRQGKATPTMGWSTETAALYIVDLVDQHPDYAHLKTKEWLEIDLWRLMDEGNPMTWGELWTTFKKLPNYWDCLVDGGIKLSYPTKLFWRIVGDDARTELLIRIHDDLRGGQLKEPLRAVYALKQDALLRQSARDYSFWRTQAEKIEQDPTIGWLGQLPRIR